MEKIDITKIFYDHFKTLKNFTSEKLSLMDVMTFYVLPLLFGWVISWYVSFQFMASQNTDLITFYSVFGGFMLNLLVLIYGYKLDNFKNPDLAKHVLSEIVANISYLIAVSIILVFVLFAIRVTVTIGASTWMTPALPFIKYFTVAMLIFVFVHFCLTMCMVLKRFYSLSSNIK